MGPRDPGYDLLTRDGDTVGATGTSLVGGNVYGDVNRDTFLRQFGLEDAGAAEFARVRASPEGRAFFASAGKPFDPITVNVDVNIDAETFEETVKTTVNNAMEEGATGE